MRRGLVGVVLLSAALLGCGSKPDAAETVKISSSREGVPSSQKANGSEGSQARTVPIKLESLKDPRTFISQINSGAVEPVEVGTFADSGDEWRISVVKSVAGTDETPVLCRAVESNVAAQEMLPEEHPLEGDQGASIISQGCGPISGPPGVLVHGEGAGALVVSASLEPQEQQSIEVTHELGGEAETVTLDFQEFALDNASVWIATTEVDLHGESDSRRVQGVTATP